MSFSLYDATIPSNLQILRAVDALLDKAEAFCTEGGHDAAAILGAKIADDMLPFGYQVKSCVAHSLGAVEATRAGSFSPDMSPWPDSFAGLHTAVRGAIEAETVVIAGAVTGQIKARHVTLIKTARVIADVIQERLSIEPGAFFEGNCRNFPAQEEKKTQAKIEALKPHALGDEDKRTASGDGAAAAAAT